MKRVFLLSFSLIWMGLNAQKIESLRMFSSANQKWKNTLILNKPDDRLTVSFDTRTENYIEYHLEHLDFDWAKPSGLFPLEIASQTENIPLYPKFIVTGFSEYTQYNAVFPDFGMTLNTSGNYKLHFVDTETKDTLTTRKVMVVDPLAKMLIGTFGGGKNLFSANQWEISIFLDRKLNTDFTSGIWKLVMVENYRIENRKVITQPVHHRFKGWVYRTPNPLTQRRAVYFQLDTDQHLKRIAHKKQYIEPPIYYPELSVMNNLIALGTWQPTDVTTAHEYLNLNFKVDVSKLDLAENEPLFLVGMDNEFKLNQPLTKDDKAANIYSGTLLKKEGKYNFTILNEKGKNAFTIDSQKNIQTTHFQFYLYYKDNSQPNYNIVSYQEMDI